MSCRKLENHDVNIPLDIFADEQSISNWLENLSLQPRSHRIAGHILFNINNMRKYY